MHRGSCLCGTIQYQIDGELGDFGYCHCKSCRKASGSAFGANAAVDRDRFVLLEGADSLKEFESSPGKIRTFCSNCGSPVYAFLRESAGVLRIRLGTLDTPFSKEPRAHTFVSEKADWEPIDDSIPRFSGWAPPQVLVQRGSRQKSEA